MRIAHMPRGLTKEQKLQARTLFTDLLDVQGMSQEEVAAKLGINQTTVSRGRNSGTVSMQILAAAARLSNRSDVDMAKVLGFEPTRSLPTTASSDPKFGTFLLRLGEIPGLRAWLTEHPEAATVGEVWSAVQTYEKTPTLSRTNDGQPKDGWGSFFADLRARRIGPATSRPGDASAALVIETAERPKLPPTTRLKSKSTTRKERR